MKIILLKDIPRIGQKGQILDLANAYAMNSFVNKGLAKIATDKDEKNFKERELKRQKEKLEQSDKFISIFTTLEKDSNNSPLKIIKKVDEKGHFYAKLSKGDICDAVYNKTNISIKEDQIKTDTHNIISLGVYEIEIIVNNRKYKVLVKIEK